MNRKTLLFLGDIGCFVLGYIAFIFLIFRGKPAGHFVYPYLGPFIILMALWLAVFFIFNFYDTQSAKPNLVFLRNFSIAAILMLGIGFIFFYIDPTNSISPKTHLAIFEGMSLVLMLIWRRSFYLATSNIFHTRFSVICADERHRTLTDEMTQNPQLGFSFQGSFHSVSDFFKTKPIVDLVVVHKTALQESVLLEKLFASHIDVMDLADAYETILYRIPVHFIDSNWIIHSIKKQRDFLYESISRMISIMFAIVVGLVTLPFSIITIIAIKLEDQGPIFIKQERVGINGKPFKLYKFRSMVALDKDGQAEHGTAVWSTGAQDPRITKTGRITRALHIDELPQLINIIKGDLNLVGPRPERPQFVSELETQIPYYFMRHAIKPGFTGWAQIKFRYARTVLDSQEKFEYDLYYIKNRNLFLDIGIVLKTIQIIVTHLQ